MLDGYISPILNLITVHCAISNVRCEEPYMTRSLVKNTGAKDPRRQMTNDDYRDLSHRATTGNFQICPHRRRGPDGSDLGSLIRLWSNETSNNSWYQRMVIWRWKSKWFADIGGYKAQISLDSMIAEEHDSFRGKRLFQVIRSLEALKSQPRATFIHMHHTWQSFQWRFETCVSFAETMTYHYTSHSQRSWNSSGTSWLGVSKRCRSVEVFRDWIQRFHHMTPSYGQPGRCITVRYKYHKSWRWINTMPLHGSFIRKHNKRVTHDSSRTRHEKWVAGTIQRRMYHRWAPRVHSIS